MQSIRQFWQSGWIGKIVLSVAGLLGLLVVCCVLLVVVVPRPPQSASSATAVATGLLARTASAPSAPESTATPAPTATPEPTQTPVSTDTPQPTDTPIPTSTPIYAPEGKIYPTASASLYGDLLSNKKTMTDLQYKEYLNSLMGSRVHLRAQVNEVHEDGEIYLSAESGGFFDSVYLRGVPKAIGIKLNKGQVIEFDGSIRKFNDFIVFSVYLDEPVIYTIQ